MLSKYWKTLLTLVIASFLLGSTILLGRSSSSRSANTTDVQTSNESRRQAMINILGSPNPDPAIGDEARTFDRLVGTWDVDFSFLHDDGTVSHKKGEIRFGWVMDGTAIQDLWISYPTDSKQQRSIGTTFRFFDTKLKQWRIVFINPRFNYVVTAQGEREGDRIVLRGIDTDGMPIRWTFSDITPDSFTGRAKNHMMAARHGRWKRTTT
jgi:hypothetical protein